MSSARAIIEAEDPKSVFRALLQGPAFAYVDRLLGNSGWNRLGSNQHGWRTKYEDYREAQARGTRNGPTRQRYVWWDDAQKEWVMKLEGEKWQFGRWCGNHELGVRVFKNGKDLIQAIREQHYLREAENPKAFLKGLSAQQGEHVAPRCFHLDHGSSHFVLDWHGCITQYNHEKESTHRDGSAYRFSGQWRFLGMSFHHWANHYTRWTDIRAKVLAGEAVRGYVWDHDHGSTRSWSREKGVVYVDSQWLRKHQAEQARQVAEAEDPKHFLRTLGTGEHIRTKGDLRRYIAAQIRTLPVRDSDHTSDRDELLTWYRTLDQRVMPKIIKALERFYGKQAPDGTSGLFRTWIKNSQTERRAAQILAGFEGIIEDE